MSVESILRFVAVGPNMYEVQQHGKTIAEVTLNPQDNQCQLALLEPRCGPEALNGIASFIHQLNDSASKVVPRMPALRPGYPVPRCIR